MRNHKYINEKAATHNRVAASFNVLFDFREESSLDRFKTLCADDVLDPAGIAFRRLLTHTEGGKYLSQKLMAVVYIFRDLSA